MFIFDHTRFDYVPRELFFPLSQNGRWRRTLFVVSWSRRILIYAFIVSSRSPDGQQTRGSGRQVTGRLRSSSTAETRYSVRDSAVTEKQDHVTIEMVFQKKKTNCHTVWHADFRCGVKNKWPHTRRHSLRCLKFQAGWQPIKMSGCMLMQTCTF